MLLLEYIQVLVLVCAFGLGTLGLALSELGIGKLGCGLSKSELRKIEADMFRYQRHDNRLRLRRF